MPCQVSAQSVARNSWTLSQAEGVGGSAGAGPSAARAPPAIALMTTKARTNFFTVLLLRNADGHRYIQKGISRHAIIDEANIRSFVMIRVIYGYI
jgi:hypothetical protein